MLPAILKVALFSLLLILPSSSFGHISSEVYHIISSSSDPCKREPCLTLSQFIDKSDTYLTDNFTLIFQPRNYTLNSVLSVSNISTLSMLTSSFNTVIICNGSGRFEFRGIHFIHVSNFTFVGCPENRVDSVPQFLIECSSFIGEENAPGTALEIVDTTASLYRNTFISNNGSQHEIPMPINIYKLWRMARANIFGGGALFSSNSSVNITQSWFKGNHAQVGGAILSEWLSNITIKNSTFIGNFAKTANITDTLLFSLPPITIAISAGGVLYVVGGGSVTIHNSVFIENSVINHYTAISDCYYSIISYSGGVLHADTCDAIMINHSQFVNNSVLTIDNNCGFGGVASFDASINITIMYSEFIGNSAGRGGVFYMTNGNITVAYSFFYHNSAGNGSAVWLFDCQSFTATGSLFMHNTASDYGGVVHIDFSEDLSHAQIHYIITNCSFDQNTARSGGVFSMENANIITIDETNFSGNIAKNDGGVFSDKGYTAVILNRCRFHNNRAGGDGGVFAAKGGTLSDLCSIYSNNTAGHDGGVMSSQSGHLTTQGSIFVSNYADNDGGVIRLYKATLEMIDGHCHNNSAKNNGGVVNAFSSMSNISRGSYESNHALNDGGVVYAFQSISNTSGCSFESNFALNDGGVINVYQGVLNVAEDSTFSYNTAHNDGGAIHAYEVDAITITGNTCNGNRAENRGGLCFVYQGSMRISQSIVNNNEAADVGGVLYSDEGSIQITNTSSSGNTALEGGDLHIHQGDVSISHSSFSQSSVDLNGGAWFLQDCHHTFFEHVNFTSNSAKDGGAVYSSNSTLTLLSCIFMNNSAEDKGGAIYSSQSNINCFNTLNVISNSANRGAVYFLGSVVHLSGHTFVTENVGSFMILSSKITFTGATHFSGGSEPVRSHTLKVDLREGGALTASNSDIIFNAGTSSLTGNYAENGGAIHATDHSKVYINGEVTIAYNKANGTGGGVYLDSSELQCLGNSSLNISSNTATEKGGGVHAIGSSISVIGNFTHSNTSINDDSIQNEYIGSLLYFSDNEAEKGGGLCLEVYSKLYILKFAPQSKPFPIVTFTGNSANDGGAVYVSDESNLGTCNPTFNSHYKARECVFQVLVIYSSVNLYVGQIRVKRNISTQNIYFSENHAMSGSSLFGGLLDRCKLQHFSELQFKDSDAKIEFHTTVPQNGYLNDKIVNGISYMTNISNINMSEVSSEPVQLCFCEDSVPDCNYQPDPIKVIKGKTFAVEIVAVDQVGHLISASIHSHLRRTGGGLRRGQEVQVTNETCTKLKFNLFSPNDEEELIMSAKGPCESSLLSQRQLIIHFTACDSCPIGFERHTDEDTSCQCVCDSRLEPYITKCNASTELLEREGDFWITYVNGSDNATSGYLIYSHCPLNYCKPPTVKVEINLNIPGGADVQCADGHSGMLCGRCQSNLSLSLGSSKCIPCSTNWTTIAIILVASFLVGIFLVALLLVLNLTVAAGTLNGIILYANVIASSLSTFLPSSTPNFANIFVSWLNLEIGFDTCFFKGMDAYWKTLVQLAFPLYVILLVVMVIMISERSIKFARLVARRNPIATLATLILLSYTKFLNTIIASLSYATLDYPDGSHRRVWLPDATVDYLKGKHIALFALALLILLVSVVYTGLLFSWQWLLLHQDKIRIIKWLTKSQKLCHFIEPYHAPYTFEQRYWTGLLLFVRVVLYIISAVNPTGNPQVSLVSTAILVGLLPILKAVLEKKIYKQRLVDTMEMFMYFNIAAFAIVTLMTANTKQQTIITCTSVLFTQVCLLLVILFHLYRYSGLLSVVKKIKAFLIRIKQYRNNDHIARLPPDEEDDRPLITHTVVELPSSHRLPLQSQQKDSEDLIMNSPVMDVDPDSPPGFSHRLAFANNTDTARSAAVKSPCEKSIVVV